MKKNFKIFFKKFFEKKNSKFFDIVQKMFKKSKKYEQKKKTRKFLKFFQKNERAHIINEQCSFIIWTRSIPYDCSFEHFIFWKKIWKFCFLNKRMFIYCSILSNYCSIWTDEWKWNLNSFEHIMNVQLNVQLMFKKNSNVQTWTKLNVQFCSFPFIWTFEHCSNVHISGLIKVTRALFF